MTEEEIRPIAEQYVEEYCHCSDGEYTDGSLICAGIGTAMIIARKLEAKVKKLQEENEKMKAILNSVVKSNTCADLVEAQIKAIDFFGGLNEN